MGANPGASVADLVDAGDWHSPGMLQHSLHAVRVRLPPEAPTPPLRGKGRAGQPRPPSARGGNHANNRGSGQY